MTMAHERTRAVICTRDFLRELTVARMTPGVPVAMRRRAKALLRHYPSQMDMQLAHLACPRWFGPAAAADDGG